MSSNGPNAEQIEQIQTAVQQHFDQIVNQQPGEVGTCKKMVNLGCLNPAWQHLCVVFGKTPGGFLHDMVLKERKLLAHLETQGYAIVKVFGEPFNVQPGQQRFGMIESFIRGVFIEAKTPAPLKLLLTAALLEIPCKSQEGWIAFNLQRVVEEISTKLSNSEAFLAFQARAQHLATAFENLITQLEQQHEKIHDLQMIISADGSLTVIDPLEVIKVSPERRMTSLLEDEDLAHKDLIRFSQSSHHWLVAAKQYCQSIARYDSPAQVIEQCKMLGSSHLTFSSSADSLGKSRVHQLQHAAQVKPTPQAAPHEEPFADKKKAISSKPF